MKGEPDTGPVSGVTVDPVTNQLDLLLLLSVHQQETLWTVTEALSIKLD